MIATNIKLQITNLQSFWTKQTLKLCNLATIMTSASSVLVFQNLHFLLELKRCIFLWSMTVRFMLLPLETFTPLREKGISCIFYPATTTYTRYDTWNWTKIIVNYNCIIAICVVVLLNVFSFLFLKVYYSISITLPLPSAPCSLAIAGKEDDCRFQTTIFYHYYKQNTLDINHQVCPTLDRILHTGCLFELVVRIFNSQNG